VSVRVNVSGLGGNVSSCYQLRVADGFEREVVFNVLGGDDSNWCDIWFFG